MSDWTSGKLKIVPIETRTDCRQNGSWHFSPRIRASAPNPAYGSSRQYFKLCADSNPGCAKLDISYWSIFAACSRSQAIPYRSAIRFSSGTKCAWYLVPRMRSVTIRSRDEMTQVRVPISGLRQAMADRLP